MALFSCFLLLLCLSCAQRHAAAMVNAQASVNPPRHLADNVTSRTLMSKPLLGELIVEGFGFPRPLGDSEDYNYPLTHRLRKPLVINLSVELGKNSKSVFVTLDRPKLAVCLTNRKGFARYIPAGNRTITQTPYGERDCQGSKGMTKKSTVLFKAAPTQQCYGGLLLHNRGKLPFPPPVIDQTNPFLITPQARVDLTGVCEPNIQLLPVCYRNGIRAVRFFLKRPDGTTLFRRVRFAPYYLFGKTGGQFRSGKIDQLGEYKVKVLIRLEDDPKISL